MGAAPSGGEMARRSPGCGLMGSGMVRATDGSPLRPGGRALTETLLDWAAFHPGDIVLDVGCGQGASVELMRRRGLRAIGVDLAVSTLALAARRAGPGACVMASGEMLPCRSAGADGILAECSLSVMACRRRALDDWFRVLRPGGRLAMSDIYRRREHGEDVAEPLGPPAMATWQDVTAGLVQAGFRIVRSEDRSDALKSWVARFIFEYGSLDALWQDRGGLTADAVRAISPGYFALIAEKPAAAVENRP